MGAGRGRHNNRLLLGRHLMSGEALSLREAGGDEAIFCTISDCFAMLAMTCTVNFQTPSRVRLMAGGQETLL